MKFWEFIKEKLEQSKKLMLLVVIDSKGSSPGRLGFKMAVCDDLDLAGSVGGGSMEYDIVELARAMLHLGRPGPVMKKQIHKTNAGEEHSGMICSGEQTIVLIALEEKHKTAINQLVDYLDNNKTGVLRISTDGFSFIPDGALNQPISTFIENEAKWEYKELAGYKNRICIIGAGHVGLALSKLMKDLGFIVEIFDDRENLNTYENNVYADKKQLIKYSNIDQLVPEGDSVYVVIMTFTHKSDQDVLAKLIGKKFKYLGLMGSKTKVAKLYQNIGYQPNKEGVPKIYSPIGIPIHSKTPMEIAVSIAAEIIRAKNEDK